MKPMAGAPKESSNAAVTWWEELTLAGWVALCLGVGAIGGWVSARSLDQWYPLLHKPWWTPPAAVFAPVWSLLYLTMGVAAWMVWRRGGPNVAAALAVFLAQLALNLLWSVIFFGLRAPGPAAIELLVLWCAIAAAIVLFHRVAAASAWLLAPYLVWVTFAGTLNYSIWRLN